MKLIIYFVAGSYKTASGKGLKVKLPVMKHYALHKVSVLDE